MEYIQVSADPFSILTIVVAPAVAHQCIVGFGAGHEQSPGARGRSLSRRDRAIIKTRAERQGIGGLESPASRAANARSAAVTSASLLLPGPRTVRQFRSNLDRRFYCGVLRRTNDVPDSSRSWRFVRSLSGHLAGMRRRLDDSRNAAGSHRLSR